jgi:hypothetical protein
MFQLRSWLSLSFLQHGTRQDSPAVAKLQSRIMKSFRSDEEPVHFGPTTRLAQSCDLQWGATGSSHWHDVSIVRNRDLVQPQTMAKNNNFSPFVDISHANCHPEVSADPSPTVIRGPDYRPNHVRRHVLRGCRQHTKRNAAAAPDPG